MTSELLAENQRIVAAMFPEYTDPIKGRTSAVQDTPPYYQADPSEGCDPGYINVRLDGARASTVCTIGPLMRPNWERIPNQRVDTGINSSGQRVCIKPSDDLETVYTMGNTLSSVGVETRVFGAQNFAPGMCTPWADGGYGLNVQVQAFTHLDKVVQGAVAVAVPGSANQTYLGVIYYRVSTDALGVVYSTAALTPAGTYTLYDAVAVALPYTDCIRLDTVILENGQTDVDNTTLFLRTRDFLTLDGQASTFYQTVQDNGTPETQRSALNFIGATVADNPGNDSTDITISAGSLTYDFTQLSGDVSMTSANTFYDAVSLSLAAGTWLISGNALATCVAFATDFTAKIWDGSSTVYASTQAVRPAAGVNQATPMALPAVIAVLSGSTTVKLSVAGDNATCVIRAAAQYNGAGNNATWLTAVQIA